MLRIGIMGAGHFAERHLAALESLRDRVKVVKVARRHLDRPFPQGEAVGAEMVAPEALIESPDVDIVCVCSPNDRHRAHTEAALRAGKHVFCEKPLALSVADADAVIRAASEATRVLMVGHLTRHAPLYKTVADVLASGRIGAPRCAYASRLHVGSSESWRMDPIVGGGAPFDLLIHDFDLMNWYVGVPERVVARGQRRPERAYESMVAVFIYPTGAIATVEGGFVLRPGSGLRAQLRIVGDHGHLEVNSADPEQPIRIFAEGEPEERIGLSKDQDVFSGIAGEWVEFLGTIAGRPHNRLRVEDARLAVQCAALAVQSADESREMQFD